MKKLILILAFLFWGIGCFLSGYLVRGWVDVESSYQQRHDISIAGAGDSGNRKTWEER